jgi:archaellum component FlaC
MTDIEVLILLVLAVSIGAFIGWKASAAFHQNIFAEMLERLDVSEAQLKGMVKEMADEAGLVLSPQESKAVEWANEINIRIEQHKDTLYAYRKDTEEFLGQGTDKDELIERLNTKFPGGARLSLSEDDGAAHFKK